MSPTGSGSTACNQPIPGEPQWTEQQHLLHLLQDRDIACPRCGANLRGLHKNRCPGCDSELTLSLSPVKWHLGPWAAATAALCISAGLGLFFLVVIIKEGWPTGIWIGLQISLTYLLLSIPCAAGIVTLRRRYQRMNKIAQQCLAAISLLLTGTALVLLFSFFLWLR